MSILTKCFAPVAVAFGFVTAPIAASAATITIFDISGGDADVVIVDTGVLTSASAVGTTSSGMSYDITVTPFEAGGFSRINTISVTTSGAGTIGIQVSEDGFTKGSAAPDLSGLRFSMSSTDVGHSITGDSWVNSSNTLNAMEDQIGGQIVFDTPFETDFDSAVETDTGVVASPFSFTSYFVVAHDDASDLSSFNASAIATVPLPAAGLLLLGALGGLGMMRRKS